MAAVRLAEKTIGPFLLPTTKSCREKTTAEGIKCMRLFLRRVVTELLGQLPTPLQQASHMPPNNASALPLLLRRRRRLLLLLLS
eukprot:COSAG06_NODE_541_length_14471_cov_35.139229_12_plen_84_part_00